MSKRQTDHDFEQMLRHDLRDAAAEAPCGPSADDLMNALDRRRVRRAALGAIAGAALAAGLTLWVTVLSNPADVDTIAPFAGGGAVAERHAAPTEPPTTRREVAMVDTPATVDAARARTASTHAATVDYLTQSLLGAGADVNPASDEALNEGSVAVDPRIDLRSTSSVLAVLASADSPLNGHVWLVAAR
ncbi:MAG: hypothetical protein GC159_02015 [Phycisphaera sp.]|nr:hypothetical protein [Phycisphaera sp.]